MSEFGDEVVKDWDAFLKTNRQPSGVGPVDAFWSRVWEEWGAFLLGYDEAEVKKLRGDKCTTFPT